MTCHSASLRSIFEAEAEADSSVTTETKAREAGIVVGG